MEHRLRQDTKFCQQASQQYETLLDAAGEDPRAAAGLQALRDSSWAPTLDARDARRTVTVIKGKEIK